DLYWARSRVLEYLNAIQSRLPAGAKTRLGPDATGVGWVYQYALEGPGHSPDRLRSIQDFQVRYALQSVSGVAEVASLGGFVRQYQVLLDPARLLAYGVTAREVIAAVRGANQDVGARTVEVAGSDYAIRGLGYFRGVGDIGKVAVGVGKDGRPVRVADVARVTIGPDLRLGIAERDGKGEAVGGVVVMRYGENALRVVDGVKQRIAEIAPALPGGDAPAPPQAPRARARAADLGARIRGRGRGRAGAVHVAPHHHAVVPPGLHAGGPGRAAVPAARAHQDFRDGGRGAALGDARARAHGLVREGKDPCGGGEPAQPLGDPGLSAAAPMGPARPLAGAGRRGGRPAADGPPVRESRQ